MPSRKPSTEELIWELASFLGKRGWAIQPAPAPPAVCVAAMTVWASAFVLVFVDGRARGAGRPKELLAEWVDRVDSELDTLCDGAVRGAPFAFVALTFCDLPEPLASSVLDEKDQRTWAARHGFCRSIDFAEGTVREHRGTPFFSSYGIAEIAEFLRQWRDFAG